VEKQQECLTIGLGRGGRHGDGVEVAVKSDRGEVVGRSVVAAMSSDDGEGGGASRRSQHSSRSD
jgi:hypothetical protein